MSLELIVTVVSDEALCANSRHKVQQCDCTCNFNVTFDD